MKTSNRKDLLYFLYFQIFKGSKPLLLLSNQAGIKIAALHNPGKIKVSMDDLKNVVAVDYWLEGKLMFWTDTVLRTIKSANFNGTQIKDVVKFGLERPCK